MDSLRLRNKIFYQIKPLLPRRLQIWLRSRMADRKRRAYAHLWPILEAASQPPEGWAGWPDQRQFALVLMHDVEHDGGQRKCAQLMRLEQELGFRSSFNFVPERYRVSPDVRRMLVDNGFEVGVHGLTHDGKLYQSRETFLERAAKINSYIQDWNAVGFCSPASHHNLAWNHDLMIDYDSSTFDSDPFEPQPDAVNTIFPFWVSNDATGEGYVELPYTLPQDFTLFILLKEKTIDIWKRKLAWVARKGGMVLVTTHPDYMNFDGRGQAVDEYPADNYVEFLNHVKTHYQGQYWHALPREVASFYRQTLSAQREYA